MPYWPLPNAAIAPLLVVLSSQVIVAEKSVLGLVVFASASVKVAICPLNALPSVALIVASVALSPALRCWRSRWPSRELPRRYSPP